MQRVLFIFALLLLGVTFVLFQYWQHLEEPVTCDANISSNGQCPFGNVCHPGQSTARDPLPNGMCRPWLERFFSE